nr:MAG TPA: hypothetical protein [Caudoviricetes sp.]
MERQSNGTGQNSSELQSVDSTESFYKRSDLQ